MTEDFEEWEYIVNQSHAMPDFMTAQTVQGKLEAQNSMENPNGQLGCDVNSS